METRAATPDLAAAIRLSRSICPCPIANLEITRSGGRSGDGAGAEDCRACISVRVLKYNPSGSISGGEIGDSFESPPIAALAYDFRKRIELELESSQATR